MVGTLLIALICSSLADTLMIEKDYFRAITEFKRMLFFGYPDSNHIYHNMGICYSRLQNYEKALVYFGNALLSANIDPISTEHTLDLAYVLSKNKQYEETRLVLQDIENNEAKKLYAMTYVFEGKYREGTSLLASIGLNYQYINPHRNAIFSAIIPGSGQIIAGRIKEGIVSFLLNTGFAYLTYKSLRARDYATSLFYGSLLFRFYKGNISGSYKFAEEKNVEKIEKLYNRCE